MDVANGLGQSVSRLSGYLSGAVKSIIDKDPVLKKNERELRRIRFLVEQVSALEPEMQALPDEAFPKLTGRFRERLAQGETIDDLLPEAFAAVREASVRTLGGMRPFDEQVLGGIVLNQGKIAEMKTGEGKTLAATMPIYLNALTGKGAHVVTVNDYLARRDAEWMGQIYRFLGLSVGCVLHDMDDETRKKAYACDITYGTNNEIGFDYLRDNMKFRLEDYAQRDLHYAIVDEVDSILIDEARTPLIISGEVEQDDHSFDRYKPAINSLMSRQKTLVDAIVKEAVAITENGDEAAQYVRYFKLLQVKHGDPSNKLLSDLVTGSNDVAKKLRRWEDALMREKRMQALSDGDEDYTELAEPRLLYTVSERERSADLTELGRYFLARSEPDLFIFADLEAEFDRIDKDEEFSGEEKEAQKAELQAQTETLNLERQERLHSISQLLKAYVLFQKDVDYVVNEGQVVIVDEFTGRLMPGRRYSDGLHQALEAKENVEIAKANQTLATVTIQNFFRLYDKLAGMTGTAATEAAEFMETYKLDTMIIPTHLPMIRDDEDDVVYRTESEKQAAIIEDIKDCHQRGQPVLVGTTSIEKSELLSRLLGKDVPHHVLNARNHTREAEIVSQAGRFGAVTISTNMAGRGTDIMLGGNPEFLARQEAIEQKDSGNYEKYLVEYRRTCAREREQVLEAGGLRIVGTERHESRRIDNQLRGRSGRQGDPGSSRFYLSLEDDLMRIFGSERISGIMAHLGMEEGVPIEAGIVSRAIENAQRKVETNNFGIRKHLLEYDDVLNRQRDEVYRLRRRYLAGEEVEETVLEWMEETILDIIERCGDNVEPPHNWDPAPLNAELARSFYIEVDTKPLLESLDRDELTEKLVETCEGIIEERKVTFGVDVINRLEQGMLLDTLDSNWREYLMGIDHLRESVSLMSLGGAFKHHTQKPIDEYRYQARETFEEMAQAVRVQTVSRFFQQLAMAQFALEEERRQDRYRRREQELVLSHGEDFPKPQTVRRAQKKVGRNAPCPCGSGKKYKRCCGRG